MIFKEDTNFLSDKSKKDIENFVLGEDFPYFLQPQSTTLDNNQMFTHVVLRRPEERISNEIYNSPHYQIFLDIFKSFFQKNYENINLNDIELLRICVNLTFNNGGNKSAVHKDHTYKHYQLIVYLNDADEKSKTVILDENEQILKEIVPKKFKGVMFEDCKHFNFYPITGIRSIIIYTFRFKNYDISIK